MKACSGPGTFLQNFPREGQPPHPSHYLAVPGEGVCPWEKLFAVEATVRRGCAATAGISRGLWVPLLTAVLTTITRCAVQTCLGAAPSGLCWASSWGNFRARLACPCPAAGLKAAEDLRSPLPCPEDPSPWLGTSAGLGCLSDRDLNPHPWEVKSLVVMPFSGTATAFTVRCGQWTKGCPITSPGSQADAFLFPLHDGSPVTPSRMESTSLAFQSLGIRNLKWLGSNYSLKKAILPVPLADFPWGVKTKPPEPRNIGREKHIYGGGSGSDAGQGCSHCHLLGPSVLNYVQWGHCILQWSLMSREYCGLEVTRADLLPTTPSLHHLCAHDRARGSQDHIPAAAPVL